LEPYADKVGRWVDPTIFAPNFEKFKGATCGGDLISVWVRAAGWGKLPMTEGEWTVCDIRLCLLT
jgi:hypothetical protein